METSPADSRALHVVESSSPSVVDSPLWNICCPHYQKRQASGGEVAVCTALPVLAPIAQARSHAYCFTASYEACPHFSFVSKEAEIAASAQTPKGIAIDWTMGILRESGWVVGIPAALVIVIIIALMLTQ